MVKKKTFLKKNEEGKKKVRKEKEIVIDHLYFDH